MMTPTPFDRLQAEKGVVLRSVHYDVENRTLAITIDGTRFNDVPGGPQTGQPELDAVLAGSFEIVVRPGCRRYVVRVDRPVGFQIRDECFVHPEAGDTSTTPLRPHTRSAFLEHMAKTTFAADVLNGPVAHWAVVTFDDVIDIATQHDAGPRVSSRVLTTSDLWSTPA